MEPANLNSHQQQFVGYFSSLLFQPDYKISSTNHINSGIIWESSRDSNIMLGLNDATANDMLLSKIKQEMPADSFPKLMSEINIKEYSHSNYHYYHNDNLAQNNNCNFLSGHHVQLSATAGEFDFSHILPSLNLSNSESCLSLLSSNSLELNLQDQDFFTEFRDSPSTSSNQSTTGKKRAVNITKSNSFCSEAKKHKPSSTSSCPPLKEVKKEKVRERIATLQRLIAPYGKTDTASVLTETIGYIQFLHDQLQTMSLPYISSSSSCNPTTKNQARLSNEEEGIGQPTRRGLSSRGLCLVPLSSASLFNSFKL